MPFELLLVPAFLRTYLFDKNAFNSIFISLIFRYEGIFGTFIGHFDTLIDVGPMLKTARCSLCEVMYFVVLLCCCLGHLFHIFMTDFGNLIYPLFGLLTVYKTPSY